MAVCKFFQQGNCRYGDKCRNEHPRSGGTSFGNNNRFGALSNTGTGFMNSNPTQTSHEWVIDGPQTELIRAELGKERPKWILSTYGAVKGTPGSLFEGNEYSSEEIRWRFYELAAKGQEVQANQEALQLWSKAETDMNNALNHASDIRKFMEDCENKRPNRYDFLSFDGTKTRDQHVQAIQSGQTSTGTTGFGAGSAFGQPSAVSSNPFNKPAAATFGQPSGPSAFGGGGGTTFGASAQPSAFGQSGLGSAAPTTTSAFGQPTASSGFGKPGFGASAFGQASFGQSAQPSQQASAFGQPAQASAFGTSGFGSSTSAFGKPAQPASVFGQQSQQTSAFGQPSQTTSAFGQPSQTTTSAFGQAAQPAFGQGSFGQGASAFGQPSKPAGFGQSAFGQPAQASTATPFGAATTSSNAGFGSGTSGAGFGQSTQQSANPFGMAQATAAAPEVSMGSDTPTTNQVPKITLTSAFGSTDTLKSSLGTPMSAQPTQSVQVTQPVTGMTAPVPNTNTSATPHPLTGKPPAPLVYTQQLPLGPTQADMAKVLSTFRAQPVRYLPDTSMVNPKGTTVPCYGRPDRKGAEKIWFPEGGATMEVVALNRDDKLGDLQAAVQDYSDDVKLEYRTLFTTGKFEPGRMPQVPPMREWIAYDF